MSLASRAINRGEFLVRRQRRKPDYLSEMAELQGVLISLTVGCADSLDGFEQDECRSLARRMGDNVRAKRRAFAR